MYEYIFLLLISRLRFEQLQHIQRRVNLNI